VNRAARLMANPMASQTASVVENPDLGASVDILQVK
jgi:hypothetical protein